MLPFYTFGISFGAIVALILFRAVEERNGVTIAKSVRARLDKVVVRVFINLDRVFSRNWERFLRDSSVYLLHQLSLVALFLVRFLERRLVRLINFIKGKHATRTDKSVSSFLQDVSSSSKENHSVKTKETDMKTGTSKE
jgi:hypothetical protein